MWLAFGVIVLAPARPIAAPRDTTADAARPASRPQPIDPRTPVDHDGVPIPQPPDAKPNLWGAQIREAVIDPLTHIFDIPDKLLMAVRPLGVRWPREAVNVNAFDEVPNNTWFVNRNHVRAVPPSRLVGGPYPRLAPATPWTIKQVKRGGYSMGFQIKDAKGKRWLVKLDPTGYPQLGSNTDWIARTLLDAAGYNVPHNEPIRFRRQDLVIDEELVRGGEHGQLDEAGLDTLLARTATLADSSYSGYASLFLEGHLLGAPSMLGKREGDPNDWYKHKNRRELRGLYVLCSWIGSWDTKDDNFVDTFAEGKDSLGHVQHYVLDSGSSLGAAALTPKLLWHGYESYIDFGWVARRLVTLGWTTEPWRRARQETGIPSAGNFEYEVYEPDRFATYVLHPAFREMTDRDGYWGAKIVASFSDQQIAAAVQGAGYEDPRATEFLTRALIARRDKVARHWFDRIAPLDFFHVRKDALCFHDLAVDRGLAAPRAYEVRIEASGGRQHSDQARLSTPELRLAELGDATRVTLTLSIAGADARPTRVELTRRGDVWEVASVRHG